MNSVLLPVCLCSTAVTGTETVSAIQIGITILWITIGFIVFQLSHATCNCSCMTQLLTTQNLLLITYTENKLPEENEYQ